MKNTILFTSPALWPSAVYDYGLIQKLKSKYEKIDVINCFENSNGCPANKFSLKFICKLCNIQSLKYQKLINSKEINYINLSFDDIKEKNNEINLNIASTYSKITLQSYYKDSDYIKINKLYLKTKYSIYNFLEKLDVLKKSFCENITIYIYNGRFYHYGAAFEILNKKYRTIVYEVPLIGKTNIQLLDGYLLNDSKRFREDLYKIYLEAKNNNLYISENDILSKLFLKKNLLKKIDFEPVFHKNFNYSKTINFLKEKLNLKFIVLFSSSLWEIESHIFGKRDAGSLIQIIDYVLQTNPADILIVRFHPANSNPFAKDITNIMDSFRNKKVFFILPKSTLSSYALIDESECVISVGSQMGMESFLRNKLALSFTPTRYDSFIDDCYKIDNFHEDFYTRLNKAKKHYKSDLENNYESAINYYYSMFNFGTPLSIEKISLKKNYFITIFFQLFDKIWYYYNIIILNTGIFLRESFKIKL
jgi:hypothetical protein